MSIGAFFRYVSLGFAVIPITWAAAERRQPENQYFRGVEDRLDEADAVVVGRAEIVEKTPTEDSSRWNVTARIHVAAVLKGDASLREIEYTSIYAPRGYTSFSGKKYWSTEDEEHSRMVECFPYALHRSAIFFLKQQADGSWEPFYAYLDDDSHTVKRAIESIIAAQLSLAEQPSVGILVPMLHARQPLLLREYALRALMRHVDTWPERASALLTAREEFAVGDEFYSYTITCVVAHLRYEGSVPHATAGLDLVVALIGKAPSAEALDTVVHEVGRISTIFQANPEQARDLHDALLRRRAELTGQEPR